MCITQSDTFRYVRPRYLITEDVFFGDGDGGRGRRRWGPSGLGYYKQLLLPSPTANVTRAMRTSPTHMTRA